jgi:hypothetical protein
MRLPGAWRGEAPRGSIDLGSGRSWIALPVLVIGVTCGLFGYAVAQVGPKGQLVVAAGLGMAVAMLLARDRPLLLLLALAAGSQFLVMKSLGPLSFETAGGAPGLYVSSVDVLLLILYGVWLAEGTLVSDLRRAFRDASFLIPVVAMLAVLPSLLVAENAYLGMSELVRMAALYGLYVYVGLRVRTRRQLAYALAGLLLIAIVQCAIVLLQWRTGNSLGFAILGQETAFATRLTEQGEVLRPSGSYTHPVFLGAVMGAVALLSFSLSFAVRGVGLRLALLGAGLVAVVPIVIGQSRGPLIALAGASLLLLALLVRGGFVPGRAAAMALGALFGAAVLVVLVVEPVRSYLGSDLRLTEFSVRMELNEVALNVIRDVPMFGVGLNNYEIVMDRYAPNGVRFPDFPVHNLFLLVWAETGVVGLLALLAVFGLLLARAGQLTLARDPFLRALGAGLAAIWLFFGIEEMSSFTLRHAAPGTIFWILAGLTIAGWRMSRSEAPTTAQAPGLSDVAPR